MEPRLLRHGNLGQQGGKLIVFLIELQWSHVFSDMEIKDWYHTVELTLIEKLQWSHVFSDMEMP